MSTPNPKRHEKLLKDLAELKLHRIAEIYQEVLDEAARKQSSMLEVLAAISLALQYQTYDAAYVETLLLQERRRCEIPSPTPLQPKRRELIEDIHLEEPDPGRYDSLFGTSQEEEKNP